MHREAGGEQSQEANDNQSAHVEGNPAKDLVRKRKHQHPHSGKDREEAEDAGQDYDEQMDGGELSDIEESRLRSADYKWKQHGRSCIHVEGEQKREENNGSQIGEKDDARRDR